MANMKNKAKEILTNNFSLKLIAVIIAAVVWLIVVNVNDPEKTIVIYNVPVTVTDQEVVSDMNMVYEIVEGDTINITITGKRSVLSGLGSDDFVATASLKEMSKVNAVPIQVTTKDADKRSKISIDNQSKQSLVVELENVEEDTFDITLEYKGATAEGYTPGKYTLASDTVDISAPTSVLDRIDKVVAVCNLNGNSEDFTDDCKLVLYDRNNNKIKDSNIKLSQKTVEAQVTIWYMKETSLIIETLGNPEDGYEVGNITYSQDKVTLIGEKEVLDEINSLVVNSQISIEGETEDVVRTIDLNDYLPDGVSIQGESEVEVTIEILQLTNETFTLSASDIEINNVPEGKKAEITKDVEVILRGDSEVIEDIAIKQFNASIDLKGKKEGKVKVEVSITIPDGTELVEKAVATVEIK